MVSGLGSKGSVAEAEEKEGGNWDASAWGSKIEIFDLNESLGLLVVVIVVNNVQKMHKRAGRFGKRNSEAAQIS